MSNHIHKDDTKRWFYVQDNGSGEESLIVFGNGGEIFIDEVVSGQPILEAFLTETELESAVNTIANDSNFYQNTIEEESPKFQQPSTLYTFGLRNMNP